jgi:phosphotransferase system  glucose/maltose/N-acetylglucosamine-specific IIC component
VKEFAIYTGLRVLLFVGSLITVMLIWSLVTGSREIPALWPVIIAFAVSGVLSYFLLNKQRDAFARRVEERASRAASAFEQRKAREDQDD